MIENGSGLSRVERISAQSLAGMLEYGLTSPFASDFLSSLPLAATDGTLAKRFVNQLAEGNAYLKTGTLTGVKAPAGYLLLPDGRRMLFVGIVNHGNAEAAHRKALDSAVDWVRLSHGSREAEGVDQITAAVERRAGQRKRASGLSGGAHFPGVNGLVDFALLGQPQPALDHAVRMPDQRMPAGIQATRSPMPMVSTTKMLSAPHSRDHQKVRISQP